MFSCIMRQSQPAQAHIATLICLDMYMQAWKQTVYVAKICIWLCLLREMESQWCRKFNHMSNCLTL